MSSDSGSESPPEGVSLDGLTEAYAEAMGSSAKVAEESESAPQGEPSPEIDQPAAETEPEADAAGGACPISPTSILEAMLFVGNRRNEPLSGARAAESMRDVEAEDVAPLVEGLNRRYSLNGCPYMIANDGTGYRLVLRKAFHGMRNRFYGQAREARLSQAAIDVLAVVAYQQPISAEEVAKLRGRPSNNILRQLVRRGLLRIERTDSKKRTVNYFTTDRFLELFGMDSLEDLPRSEDLDRQ